MSRLLLFCFLVAVWCVGLGCDKSAPDSSRDDSQRDVLGSDANNEDSGPNAGRDATPRDTSPDDAVSDGSTDTTSSDAADRDSQSDAPTSPDAAGDTSNDFCDDRPSLSSVTSYTRASEVMFDSFGTSDEDGFLFASVFGNPFPSTQSSQRRIRLYENTYASMRFTTPDAVDRPGKFYFDEQPAITGFPLVAMSPCEGDFNPDGLPDGCVKKFRSLSAFYWTMDPADDVLPKCLLEPGKTYYFNIMYTADQPEDWPPTWDVCFSGTDGGKCGNTVKSMATN